MCFVVFCGVLRVFCDVLRVFCGVLRVFCSIQYFHKTKTHKTPEKHRKTLENTKNSQYACVLRDFLKSRKIRLYCTKHFSQNICKTPQNAKRKTPQNTAKKSQNAFCEITPQNTAKRTRNARKRHKTLTIQPQYTIHIARIRCFLPTYGNIRY